MSPENKLCLCDVPYIWIYVNENTNVLQCTDFVTKFGKCNINDHSLFDSRIMRKLERIKRKIFFAQQYKSTSCV